MRTRAEYERAIAAVVARDNTENTMEQLAEMQVQILMDIRDLLSERQAFIQTHVVGVGEDAIREVVREEITDTIQQVRANLHDLTLKEMSGDEVRSRYGVET